MMGTGTIQETKEKVEEVRENLESLLLNEGYSTREARKECRDIFSEAQAAVNWCDSHNELERRLGWESNQDRFRLMPVLSALAPFDVDTTELWRKALISTNLCSPGVVRFIDLWYEQAPKRVRSRVISKLVDDVAPEAITFGGHPDKSPLYISNLMPYLTRRPKQLDRMFERIHENRHFLPLLSTVPLSSIPEQYQEEFRGWCGTPALETDAIVPMTRSDLRVGVCSDCERYHRQTLLNLNRIFKPSERLGRVALFYVRGELIGSMKMKGSRSILGLTTVVDSEGRHPVVQGGVYSTTKKLTELAEEACEMSGGWAKLDLNYLPLVPLKFLGHNKGYRHMRNYRKRVSRAVKKIPT